MLCEKCYKELESDLVGTKLENGDKIISASPLPDGVMSFVKNFIPIYMTFLEESKGIKREYKSMKLFKSNFCPKCGKEF